MGSEGETRSGSGSGSRAIPDPPLALFEWPSLNCPTA